MSLRQLFVGAIAVMLLLSSAVIAVFLSFREANNAGFRAERVRENAIALSTEMREDSRGLTMNIRLYGMTGDTRYKDAYMRILDESNGRVQRSDGTTISFMQKVENFGVFDEELQALNDAKALSNGLAVIETEVMEAIDARLEAVGGKDAYLSIMDQGTLKQLYRLYDSEYYEWIGKISGAVQRFNNSLFQRTEEAVKESLERRNYLSNVFFVMLGLFMIFNLMVLSFLLWSLSRSLGADPKLLEEVASSIAIGDLEAASRLNPATACGAAKALLGINDSLEKLVSQMTSSLSHINNGNLRAQCDERGFQGAYKGLLSSTNRLMQSITSYFDLISTPIMCVDTDYNILFINKKGAELGKKTFQQLRGTKCYDLFRSEACQKQDCFCSRAMRSNDVVHGETVAHPLGEELLMSFSAAPIWDDQGKIVGGFEQVFDETAIKKSQRKMQEVAGNATNIADRLASAAGELTAQVEQSSHGSEMQRERVGETATAMEEMNATVLEVAQNAAHAADNAENSRTRAHEGSGAVGKLIASIQQAETAAKGLKEHMSELGQQAEGIGGIMNVISDIADQTNLLALNAAIEAARAGDAGRGFAVVADEVRKLAEKTMVATSQVSEAVGSIQSGTQASIASTDQAVDAITRSTEHARNSQGELTQIVNLSETTADQVRAIATSAEEQSTVADEITRATEEVNQIALDVAEAMQQSTEAVRELTELATELQGLINELSLK